MEAICVNELFSGIWDTQLTDKVTSVVTDSRQAGPGSVFVAIRGDRVDGHAFVPAALAAGAVCAVVEHTVDGADPKRQAVVENTLTAHIAMAANYRARYNPTVVGVTGSVGKTTTKEFIYAALSGFGKTLRSEGNRNNEIGMPETIFRLDDSYKWAVIEMGMAGLGQIALLTAAARPAAGLITGIGVSHLELLGSRENIRTAKLEICQGMPEGAPLALCGDDPMLLSAPLPGHVRPVYFALDNREADVYADALVEENGATRFTIHDKNGPTLEAFIPALGRHTVLDALGAYALLTRMGLPAPRVAEGLGRYEVAGQRQKITENGGVTCIEDCYNAAPDSMRASLTILAGLAVPGRRIAVLGDMLELGPDSPAMHRGVGAFAAEMGVDIVLTCGSLATEIGAGARAGGCETVHFPDKPALAHYLAGVAKPGDAVLFKASHSMEFEKIVEAFYNR